MSDKNNTNEEEFDKNESDVENQSNESNESNDSNDSKAESQDDSKDKSTESKESDKDSKDSKDESKDIKEHNRKGYEQRKASDTVSREEFDKVNSKLEEISQADKDRAFRSAHPEMTDDTFNSLKAFAKGSDLEYDKALENPVFERAYEADKSNHRVSEATTSPSGKTSSGGQGKYSDMTPDEIAKRADEVKAEL